jgi:hypothetical protein
MSRFAAVHNTGKCREVAFFVKEVQKVGTPFRTETITLPNGKHPIKGMQAECYECGEVIIEQELVFVHQDLELPIGKDIKLIPTLNLSEE